MSRSISNIIVVLLLLFLLFSYVLSRMASDLAITRFSSGRLGPTILLLAGTHGNEPAGRVMLERYLSDERSPLHTLQRGKVIVVPCANRIGCWLGSRWMWYLDPRFVLHNDLNRNYTEEGTEPVSQHIIQLIREEKVDFIVDFHEGWGFHLDPDNQRRHVKSIGSTLTPTTPFSERIAVSIVDELNQTISDPRKHFSVRKETDELLTLRNFARRNGIHYVLVETTGIHHVQPLAIRLAQVDLIVKSVMEKV